ncbi:MAG: APC family permease [Candidatus Eisenbacteria bacterium]|uniref:APC family permease n=1 Tax=Eiseniibacteriota bacterium TaxID=2212470 RepID=A0A9D6QIZ0_UNCEI|nr:APC family permease [Candidatus Eisenbacteria bacterium]MBI3538670.1 APC family permease [Candidatus Eisenbacteria bacterium]
MSPAVPARIRAWILGAPRNLLDPRIHQHLALVAFFAWVGLGSDGLSSSCYGPEEAFLQLGAHRHLAIYLTVAMVATVFLISASYSHIIELFPSGGGGYLVATKLLGPTAGVVSGGALVVDYILTISISVASGGDAIFSFLPAALMPWKLTAELGVVGALVLLNLRGVKESILVLTPIFLAFIVSHAALIGYGLAIHGAQLAPLGPDTARETRTAVQSLGVFGVVVIFLRAFSLGGGTFTGIEAVSNGVGILREPRVETGKRTMLYMATSLAFTAAGILVCYLLSQAQHEEGRTLNATLWTQLAGGWHVGPVPIGAAIVAFTLISEGALLFVAAQTGFIDGPRTLAAMAVDAWVPKRFSHLSERLVTQNGILGMGIAAGLVLYYTKGAVGLLVVMYSINVFLTFTLSQLGMARHWLQVRRDGTPWKRRFTLALTGTAITAGILVVTTIIKLQEGGWVTLLATGAFIGSCFVVRAHYRRVNRMTALLDETLMDLPLRAGAAPPRDPTSATAIVLVEAFDGLGVHTLLSVQRLMPGRYRNVVFCSVGLVDSAQFKGAEAIHGLEASVQRNLDRFVELARGLGLYAEQRYSVGTDVVEELEKMTVQLVREFREAVVFAGQLVFERENLFTRSLHHETAFAIQRRLQFNGIQTVILPIRVWDRPAA